MYKITEMPALMSEAGHECNSKFTENKQKIVYLLSSIFQAFFRSYLFKCPKAIPKECAGIPTVKRKDLSKVTWTLCLSFTSDLPR